MSTGKIKRSENTYQKINTIFKRDAKNVIMQYDGFTESEFDYLRGLKWRGEEKVDGTNMRLEVSKELVENICYNGQPLAKGVRFNLDIKGKTDNAQIPGPLYKFMVENYTEEKVLAALGLEKVIPIEKWVDHKWTENDMVTPSYDAIPDLYTIYGEGYGAGIQKAGTHYISKGVAFIVFDVKVNDIYLKIDARDDIANKLGAPIVPFIGYFTLDEAIEYVRNGFKSTIAEDKNFMAEGLVLRTELGLRNRMGKRLIVKVKYEDFEKYRRVYGTDEKVEQPVNEKYVAE